MNDALGVTEWIYQQSYLQRHQFGLIGFGNNQVHWLIKPKRATQSAADHLSELPTGGGTPLALAIDMVDQVYQQSLKQPKKANLQIYLMTDGITRQTLPEVDWHCPTQVIDIERSRVRLGKARLLANALKADYCHIDDLVIDN